MPATARKENRVSGLERLGWGSFFQDQVDGELAGCRLARVVEEQRGSYRLAGQFGGWAEVSGRFRHRAESPSDYPAVGDWVGVEAAGATDRAVIQLRLERRGTVSRRAAGRKADEQVVAANVDTVFLVSALGEIVRGLSPRRIERYLAMVWEAGATPVVLLNKSDLSASPDAEALVIRERLPLVDVIIVSALRDEGLDSLAPYLRPAQTIALLGSSGVGKSTLINRLVGQAVQRVGEIRDVDGKGRHTTTSRQLVELPGGALLIDTPGMREIQPWTDEAGIDQVFDDVRALASECRFADCTHAGEPGCAVQDAVAGGRLDEDRLEHYRRLMRELAYEERKRDPLAAAAEKQRWKKIHQAQKALYRERDR
jgi:ribosome biogenesis GTPase